MAIILNIMANFIDAVAVVLNMALSAMVFLIIVRAVISWFSPDPFNPLVQALTRITEPVLAPIRRLIPLYDIGIDISPIIAFLAIKFIQIFFIQSLHQIAVYLR